MKPAAAPTSSSSVPLVARPHVDLCRCASANCRP
ncbi:putative leader peptide [Streptomyces sp. WMMC905]